LKKLITEAQRKERARDAADAMAEYLAREANVAANMMRLKALRLARAANEALVKNKASMTKRAAGRAL